MQRLPGRLLSTAIAFGLLGVALAIPSFFAPSPIMRWGAYSCGGLAALLLVFEGFVWISLNFTWKRAFLALAVSLLVPTGLIWGLSQPNGADEQATDTLVLNVPVLRPQDSEGMIEESLAETRPGYTSETLMRVSTNGSKLTDEPPSGIIVEDHTGDGATAALTATRENALLFTITGKDKKAHTLPVPVGADGVPFDQNVSLETEAGNTRNGGYLRALVNGKEVAFRLTTESIDFGDGDWKLLTLSEGVRLTGVMVATALRFVTPWALSSSKVSELVLNFRAAHPAFFNGDDSVLYPPLGDGPLGPSPLGGTFMQITLPP